MCRKIGSVFLEESAEYAKQAGYVQYWAGAFHTTVISKDLIGRQTAAQNLTLAIKGYKEKVPEDVRNLIGIDIGDLEKKTFDILGWKLP